ncbi:MAG: hypothetical protein A2X35_03780 [Elusimicrobia bacterium GWA2_61_42]|nr:MAG: hypothetical protein A2X35_03780 [Elusimicrobia bacterium GWA2_61_42]OGR77700.1 MAG: hypothetical protein A2X38_10020 [Elusimicrobia bacterium GWC2_61_25]
MREELAVKNSGAGRPAMRACALALAVLCAAAGAAGAAKIHPSAGSTSAAFLKLGVGARAVAMGGAFAAVPGDPYAVYWNPAGLADLDGERNAGLFHNEYFQGLGQEFLFYTAPASAFDLPLAGRPKNGAFGLGLNYFYTPKEMERRSGLYEADPVNPISPVEGKFGAYDVAFSAGYGWRRRADLALGAAFKVIRQSIDGESGSSVALDLGLLREFRRGGVPYTAGFTVQNLGPGLKLASRRYDLPLVFKAGLSRPLPGPGGLLTLEIAKPVDNYPSAAIGVEYPLTGRLALRSGYRYRQYGNELGAWSGFSAGAGVAFDRLSFDYAFTPFGVLGNSHRFSINLRFGAAAAVSGAAVTRRESAAAAAPEGYRNFEFKVSPRPVSLSTRGAKYEIRAVSDECGLFSLMFVTLLRGEVPAGFSVAQAPPSGAAPAGFPVGTVLLDAWRPAALPGSVQGDLKVEFRVAKEAAPAEKVALLYKAGRSWKDAGAVLSGGDEKYNFFTALVQQAAEYAAVKKD